MVKALARKNPAYRFYTGKVLPFIIKRPNKLLVSFFILYLVFDFVKINTVSIILDNVLNVILGSYLLFVVSAHLVPPLANIPVIFHRMGKTMIGAHIKYRAGVTASLFLPGMILSLVFLVISSPHYTFVFLYFVLNAILSGHMMFIRDNEYISIIIPYAIVLFLASAVGLYNLLYDIKGGEALLFVFSLVAFPFVFFLNKILKIVNAPEHELSP
jgi:hypothetical protein